MTLFRRFLLAAACALPAAPLAAQDAPATPASRATPVQLKLTRLDFMAGCWEGQLDQETIIEEVWTAPTDQMLLATTRYLNRKREATGWEFTRIAATDSGVVFAAAGNGEPENVYLLAQVADGYVLFENLAKPFPQRISYRTASDGALIARNEGEGQLSIELRMRRVRCPGERR